MAKKPKPRDALNELLAAASREVLTDLIWRLTIGRPDVRWECFDFLKTRVSVSKTLGKRSEGEIVLALWAELEGHPGSDHAIILLFKRNSSKNTHFEAL